MAIFPLPPGLTARLNIPPTYETATEDTAPPAYNPSLHRISTSRPESTPLPPSPASSPSPIPNPTPSISAPQNPPPEYSPSVYSQQRLSHYLPLSTANPNPDPDPANLTPPPSPRRLSASKVDQRHASHFQESRTDLSMRVELEAQGAKPEAEVEQGGKGKWKGKKSLFRLHRFVNGGEMEERPFWKGKFAILAVLFSVVVLVIVVVAVCVGLKGRRKG